MQQGSKRRRARSSDRGGLGWLPPAALLLISFPAVAQNVDIGALPNGSSITIEVVVTAPAPAPAGVDAFSTQGTVSGENFGDVATDDPETGTSGDPTITQLDALPDLTLTKSYVGPTPQPGDTIPYQLTYANNGNQGATGVTLSDTVPTHTTFNAGASTGVWSCADGSPAGTPCQLLIGPLAGGGAGAAATFAVDLVDPLPPGASQVINTASIADDGSNGADPNPGDNTDTAVIDLDVIPPTVDAVETTPASGGVLADCATVTVPISGFVLTFSEEMQNPPGDTDPNDVTNPDNYLLVSAGPNAAYETFACGAPGGDDVAVPVIAVVYDAVDDRATLVLDGPLDSALHRLLVCETLRDLAGNPLEAFQRSFRADPGNLFANGHFDCDGALWTESTSGEASIVHDSAVDADGSPDSGSSLAMRLAPDNDPAQAAITQCLPVTGSRMTLDGRARLATGAGEVLAITLRCDLYSSADCAGSLAGTRSTTVLLGDTAGGFIPLRTEVVAPGASSARCGFHWDAIGGGPFHGWLDGLRAQGPIFADGFEDLGTPANTETVR